MPLSEIAAGIETVTEQDDRGVAAVDATDGRLSDRLATAAEELPCSAATAATVVESYDGGASVADAAEAAGIASITAAKLLYRSGVAAVTPSDAAGYEAVQQWLAGDLGRDDALALTDWDEETFALAAYTETHDPVPELVEAVAAVRTPDGNESVRKRDRLADAVSAPDNLR